MKKHCRDRCTVPILASTIHPGRAPGRQARFTQTAWVVGPTTDSLHSPAIPIGFLHRPITFSFAGGLRASMRAMARDNPAAPCSPATPPPSAFTASAMGNDEAAAAPCFYASDGELPPTAPWRRRRSGAAAACSLSAAVGGTIESGISSFPPADDVPLLPPQLSCSRSHSMAKRRLFSSRYSVWHKLAVRLPAAHHTTTFSAATLLILLLTLAAGSGRLSAFEPSGGGSTGPQPGRPLPRLLLAGGSGWARQAAAPAQQPQLQMWPPSQHLWNATLLLEVSGSGLQPGQLAGRLRQPFLRALMPAAAAAAGGWVGRRGTWAWDWVRHPAEHWASF